MTTNKDINIANLLLVMVPLALIAPNLLLWALGSGITLTQGLSTLLLPGGIYLLIMALSRNTPRTTMILLPVMVICAFQIVVAALFHNSAPIGVDMFLNAVTTNTSEVNELLSSLLLPVGLVFVIYLPVIVAGIVGWCRHRKAGGDHLALTRRIGRSVMLLGIVLAGICLFTGEHFNLRAEMFPINSLSNLGTAIHREYKTYNYDNLSESFSYSACSERPGEKELYIAVIGETSRADNWQLFGYRRDTNPLLGQIKEGLIPFGSVLSESNTTHKAVPMLLTTLTAERFDKEIYTHKSVITAFKEAGFATAFISNQEKNKSLIDKYAAEADLSIYLPHESSVPDDRAILPLVDSIIDGTKAEKLLIVVHTHGSHYKYHDRYPSEAAKYKPDKASDSGYGNRRELTNAYDNSIINTDYVLSQLISLTNRQGVSGALLYCSDHGEDLYDDARKRFLHSSPTPSYWQLHVPMLIYLNEDYRFNHPEESACASNSRHQPVSSSRSFAPTLLQLGGIATPRLDKTASVVSDKYEPLREPQFLNDRNNALGVKEAGFSQGDLYRLHKFCSPQSQSHPDEYGLIGERDEKMVTSEAIHIRD